jgi:hypothetical protein
MVDAYRLDGGPQSSNPTIVVAPPRAPASVTLSRFVVSRATSGLRVSWTTQSERNTVGFYLMRVDGRHSSAAMPAGATRVNPSMIQGNAAGATYSYFDISARAGAAYTYYLVEIESDGTENVYGPAATKSANQVYLPAVSQ